MFSFSLPLGCDAFYLYNKVAFYTSIVYNTSENITLTSNMLIKEARELASDTEFIVHAEHLDIIRCLFWLTPINDDTQQLKGPVFNVLHKS